MKDTLSMIIAVIFIVLFLVILPLYNYFERQDDMSYNLALKTVTTFVDEVTENGYLDQTTYDKFINRLASSGNTYDIQIEAQKRILTVDPNNIDDENPKYIEQYKAYYNKDIFNDETGKTSNIITKDNSLKNNIFFLDEGDKFYVTVKNTNTTMASALLGTIIHDATNQKINLKYGAIVKNNNWKNSEISQLYQSDILIQITQLEPNDAEKNTGYPEYNFEIARDRTLSFNVKILNADDTGIINKIKENIRLVGTYPNCYISPSSIEAGSTDNEYKIKFELDNAKARTYFGESEYNFFKCFLPANVIQGKFTKNASATSNNIVVKINGSVELPKE